MIRRAVPEDLDRIVAIERASPMAPHWPRLDYELALTSEMPLRVCLVALRDAHKAAMNGAPEAAEVIGFAVGSLAAGEAELESVVVSDFWQGRGVGRALVCAVLEWVWDHGASEIALEVRRSSAAAQKLYRSLGFVACGRRPDYYQEPVEDALLMRRSEEEKTKMESPESAPGAAKPNV